VATIRLRLPRIAKLAIYSVTSEHNYIQTLPNIVVPPYILPLLARAAGAHHIQSKKKLKIKECVTHDGGHNSNNKEMEN
jgi:hypothetical protein